MLKKQIHLCCWNPLFSPACCKCSGPTLPGWTIRFFFSQVFARKRKLQIQSHDWIYQLPHVQLWNPSSSLLQNPFFMTKSYESPRFWCFQPRNVIISYRSISIPRSPVPRSMSSIGAPAKRASISTGFNSWCWKSCELNMVNMEHGE